MVSGALRVIVCPLRPGAKVIVSLTSLSQVGIQDGLAQAAGASIAGGRNHQAGGLGGGRESQVQQQDGHRLLRPRSASRLKASQPAPPQPFWKVLFW